MLKHVLGLALILTSQASIAGNKKFFSSKPKAFSSFIQALNQNQEFSLASVKLSPAQPKQGDKITAFVILNTGYESTGKIKPIVSGKLNGKDIQLVRRGNDLWAVQPVLVHSQGENVLELKLWLEDQESSVEIQKAITSLNQELIKLQSDLAREVDFGKKSEIQASIDLKIRQKTDLENTLSSLKRPIGTKITKFNVGEASSSNSIYPKIESIQPQVGSVNGGERVIVAGLNFEGVTSLKIGTTEISGADLVITPNRVEFTAPPLNTGLYNIEVSKVVDGENVNAKLDNAYYAMELPQESTSSNPIAFAGLPAFAKVEESIQLDGSQSYSSDGNPLSSYKWRIVSKPMGATANDGVISDDSIPRPIFTASVEGNWVVALTVGSGNKISIPSLTTITVGPKSNITIIPSKLEVVGVAGSSIVSQAKICNNTNTKIRLGMPTSNSAANFLEGGLRDVAPFSCLVSNYASLIQNTRQEGVVKIVVMDPGVSIVSLEYAVTPTASILKWYSASDLNPASEIQPSNLNLVPTHDVDTVTSIYIKNTSSSQLTLTEPPVCTDEDITFDFPSEGVVLLPNDLWELRIHVRASFYKNAFGNFSKFYWYTSEQEGVRVQNVAGSKLLPPSSYNKALTLSATVGGAAQVQQNLMETFFGFMSPSPDIEAFEFVSNDAPDSFSYQTSWTSLRTPLNGATWTPIFSPTAAGSYSAKATIKLSGYSRLFEVDITGLATEAK